MLRKIVGLGLLVAAMAFTAWADGWNKKTILTVKEPIQVPGAILQPGVYVLKLVDSLADRHIVQILNEREDEVITTTLAIPNYRLEPTGKSQFNFWETPAGNPPALRAWFYPGDNFGQEFAYPKGLSAKIAEFAQENVPTTPAVKEIELATAPVVAVDKSGTEKPIGNTVNAAPAPPVATEAAPVPEPVQADRSELPATASHLPEMALAAIFAMAAGFMLRSLTSAR